MRWSSEPLQGKNQHRQSPGKAFFQSGKYVGLWCCQSTECSILCRSGFARALHPSQGWQAALGEDKVCTPKSPAPVGVCEDCCKEAWFCLCLSLLAASSTGAEQQQNKSRHQINCNPVMNTILAAVLICSLHAEENCSLCCFPGRF